MTRSTGTFGARLRVTSEAVETNGFVVNYPPVRIPISDIKKVEAIHSRLSLPWHRYGVRFHWNGDGDMAFMTRRSSRQEIIAALREAGVKVIDAGDRWLV